MARTDSSSKRKKIKGNRKKKSRRNKSKKLRHSDDSLSSCSDDESRSLSLDLSSSSEGEYRRKSKRGRGRSRSRNEVKGSKKRSRRRSLSEGSDEDEDEDEDTLPVKKRKKSKKDKKTKKKKNKKKLRRDDYVSSASSDSRSCSTCKDEDSSGDEVASHGMSRGRSKEKKEVHRGSTKGRIGNKKKRSKSSSFSPTRSYDSESIEKVMTENNPVRLKSVIIVANLENEEEEDMKHDELKEENVYDYDDYPSSKSNDSTELVDRFTSSPDKTSVVKEVNSGVNLNDIKEKESSASGTTGLKVDNLELILRQKALENLSKFRGGSKTKPVDAKPMSNKSVVTQPTHETVNMKPVSHSVTDRSKFTWRRDPSVTTGKMDETVATYSEPHSSGSHPAELKLQSANISSTSKVDNKFVEETSKILVDTNNVDQKSTAVVETPSASFKEGSSNEQHVEGNDNSQFKKKTMSVMRGGEMVEVSYKVYIPNRAPALARRQLKR